tara:strand:- start:15 stop:698 length:684 start_codon:yes stop_codon:yes gene_type:complete
MKNICLIPARGGSKRIPKKNIKTFHGKPLIAWSIECAINSGLFENVYVSTDCKEIAKIATKFGASIPFKRPSSISDDYALDKDVRNHFIDWMKESCIEADYLFYLYPTAAFITEEILEGCMNALRNTDASSSLTVTSYSYPVLRALKQDKEGYLTFKWEENSLVRSQDLEDLIHDAGLCYCFDLGKYCKSEENVKRVGYMVTRDCCQDIDTMEDFKFAEKLFMLHNK